MALACLLYTSYPFHNHFQSLSFEAPNSSPLPNQSEFGDGYIKSANCIQSVSYTHLDVYKRQVTDRVNPNHIGVDIGCGMLCVEIENAITEESFPDIDVYKRQSLNGVRSKL